MRTTFLLRAVLAVAFVACGPPPRTELHTRKQRIAVLPKDKRAYFAMTKDGRHWAVKAGPEVGRRIVRDGVDGPTYGDTSEPFFTADGTLVYWRMPDDPAATGLPIVVGDETIETEIARPGPLVFSEEGNHWAVAGGIAFGDPLKRDAEGKVVRPKRGPVIVLHDGREIGRHSDTSLPAIDARGEHVAYLARDDAGKVSLAVDGKLVGAPFETAPGLKPPTVGDEIIGPAMKGWYKVRYLDDGSILSVSDHPDGWAVRRNDEVLASYAWATEPWPPGATVTPPQGFEQASAFIPNSIELADGAPSAVWWERLAGDASAWRVVRNGKPVDSIVCPRPWERARPATSADGQHVAYVCGEPLPTPMGSNVPFENLWVVHDGTRYGPYQYVWGVTLSPDGKHVAYAVADANTKDTMWRYFRDGKPVSGRFFESWQPRFGPDNRRLAWQTRGLEDKRRLVFENKNIARFDEVVWGPTFLGPDAVAWVVRRDEELWRIEAWYGDDAPPSDDLSRESK